VLPKCTAFTVNAIPHTNNMKPREYYTPTLPLVLCRYENVRKLLPILLITRATSTVMQGDCCLLATPRSGIVPRAEGTNTVECQTVISFLIKTDYVE
jgi:hypothetical protein